MKPEDYRVYAQRLNDISPWSPYVGALLIENDWDNASKDLKKWEELAASHPGLMRSVARRYINDNRNDDAVRCLKTAISVSPDNESYQILANLYYKTGDKKKYVAALEESLNCPDYALNHGKASEQIADFYMTERRHGKRPCLMPNRRPRNIFGLGIVLRGAVLSRSHAGLGRSRTVVQGHGREI